MVEEEQEPGVEEKQELDMPEKGEVAGKELRKFEDLPAAAQRALLEAEQRLKAAEQADKSLEKELGGREGLEPTRYGDWEKKGIVSDF